jgi:imidazolonepropionase-like amidohydrolase
MRRLAFAATAALVLASAPAFARAETVAIVGGTVYPVSGPRINNGTVIVVDGRIAAVGSGIAIPANARRIDARGKVVTPGFINVGTQIGLSELGGETSTRDSNARGVVNAAFRPWDGFNSQSAYIASTRNDGITTIGVIPGGGFIQGQTALFDLDRGTAHEMLRKAPTAMSMTLQLGRGGGGFDDETAGAPNTAGNEIDAAPASRGQAFGDLRALLDDTRFYAAHKKSYDNASMRGLGASREALEAMIPVVQGRLPLIVDADRLDDIDTAVRFGRDQHIKIIISGGAEAWMLASQLAAAHVPVITGAMNNIPESFDKLHQRQENAGMLRRAGVEVALIGNSGGGDEDQFNARNVRYEAGNAVSYGMSHDDALRAVTLAPATIFGVSNQVGSLQAGHDANVVVWSGDPFEFSTVAEHVFIRGHEMTDKSRQDLLIDRYRKLPRTNTGP